MLYERYRKCGRKECSVCRKEPAHGPYVYANIPKDGKNKNLYVGTLGTEKALEKVREFDLLYPGMGIDRRV